MTPYYDDGQVVIYHGDCREILPHVSADVLVTDPPYGISWSRSANKMRGSKAHAGILNDADTSARDAVLETLSNLPAIVFGSFYAPFPANVRQVLVWHKPADSGVVGSVTGYRRDAEPVFLVGSWPMRHARWSSVLRSGAGSIANVVTQTGHPHTKPVDLMRDLIDRAPDGSVIDPFMGSGSTLVAAKQLNRRAIGIEIEERYCEIAAQRLSHQTLGMVS